MTLARHNNFFIGLFSFLTENVFSKATKILDIKYLNALLTKPCLFLTGHSMSVICRLHCDTDTDTLPPEKLVMLKTFLLIFVISNFLFACGESNKIKDPNAPIPPAVNENGFKVTTFNIKYFGLGGSKDGRPQDENRYGEIKKFLETYHADTHVFVFQEIMDVNLLGEILPFFNKNAPMGRKGFICGAYDSFKGHQFTAICAKDFLRPIYGTIEEVKLDNNALRPAVTAEVSLTNQKRITIVGVHLKAFADATNDRRKQVIALSENPMIKNELNQATIIAGDFNSYPREKTGWNNSDNKLFQYILDDFGFNEIGPGHNSFIGRNAYRQFDRAWARNLQIIKSDVSGACATRFPAPYNDRGYFVRNISDHCPVTFTVRSL